MTSSVITRQSLIPYLVPPSKLTNLFTKDDAATWNFLSEHLELQFNKNDFAGCQVTMKEMDTLRDSIHARVRLVTQIDIFAQIEPSLQDASP